MSEVKITATDLLEMVEEELDKYLLEVALCHSPSTGHFTDCNPKAVYSLSHRAAKNNNIDREFVGRGNLTKKRKIMAKYGANTAKDPGGQCGRQTVQGKSKAKTKRCHDYPKKYIDEDSGLLIEPDDSDNERRHKIFPGYNHLRQLANGIMEDEETGDTFIEIGYLIDWLKDQGKQMEQKAEIQIVEDENAERQQALIQKCRELGFKTQQEAFKTIVNSLNAISLADSGRLYDPPKSGG